MRVQEIITKTNLVEARVRYEDLVLDYRIDGANVDIRAIVDGKQIGYVIFNRDGKLLIPDDLAVDAEYRGRGIAKKMYDWVKSLPQGFRIIRGDQTSMGKRFWDKNRGEGVNVWEEGVAESEKALQFATQAHLGQTRSGGEPYITHPMRVAEIVKQYKQSHNIEALIDAALLHDTLEDTDTTHEALKDLFGGLTASLVKELTSDLEKIKEVGKSKYLANKMAHELTSWALVIKLADRLDNVQDIATAKTPEWRSRYKKETEDMLSYLESNRELSGTHQKLINAIRKKLDEVSDQQGVAEGQKTSRDQPVDPEGVIYLNDRTAIVGIKHGQPLRLDPKDAKKVKELADKYGAWYEGNGMDREGTQKVIDSYRGSWDDDLFASKIKGYPYQFLYVLFANIKENNTVEGQIGFDPKVSIFKRILDSQPKANYFPDRTFGSKQLTKFLSAISEGPYDFVEMSKKPATESNVKKFFKIGSELSWPENWWEYPYKAGKVAKQATDLRDKFLVSRKSGVYVTGGGHLTAIKDIIGRKGVAEDTVDEMALASYKTLGDFDKPGGFRGVDKRLVPHPKSELKAAKFFEQTPYDFRLFFANKPGLGQYQEYGPMTPVQIVKVFGEEDAKKILDNHDDAITVVYVSNRGDQKVMMTPWIMAHRFGHAIQAGTRRDKWSAWQETEKLFFSTVNRLLDEYYGKVGFYFRKADQPNFNLTPEYNALFNAIGTQRSSRTGQIRRPYEFMYELFAQYLGTGTITLNPLPTNLGYGRKVFGNPSKYLNIKPEFRDETELRQASEILARDMELMFNDVLGNSVGQVYVM